MIGICGVEYQRNGSYVMETEVSMEVPPIDLWDKVRLHTYRINCMRPRSEGLLQDWERNRERKRKVVEK